VRSRRKRLRSNQDIVTEHCHGRRHARGCEAKTLLFDRATGLITALMRFQPGAVLPDHEETYVLEGSLVDKEGPARRASNARPANSSDASRAAATSHGVPKAG
jgi:hypothetical protein